MRLFGLDISVRKRSESAQETPTLFQRVQRLEIAFNELAEHHSALAGAHAKLRNQFHGERGGRPMHRAAQPGNVSEIPYGDKRALRAALMPGGRPVVKTDGGTDE